MIRGKLWGRVTQGPRLADSEDTVHERKGYFSLRGGEGFELFENPSMSPRSAWSGADLDHVSDRWDLGALVEKHGEAPVREKIREMIKSLEGGMVVTGLFCQGGRDPETLHQLNPNGMNLSHVWIGPHFPVFRHGHPSAGDCLYYVVAGELVMGERRLGPGSGFFLPNGHPYKYSGGPDGCELLEIRAGMGQSGVGMTLGEQSLDAIQRVIDQANAHRAEWKPPKRIGDTALRQQKELSRNGAPGQNETDK